MQERVKMLSTAFSWHLWNSHRCFILVCLPWGTCISANRPWLSESIMKYRGSTKFKISHRLSHVTLSSTVMIMCRYVCSHHQCCKGSSQHWHTHCKPHLTWLYPFYFSIKCWEKNSLWLNQAIVCYGEGSKVRGEASESHFYFVKMSKYMKSWELLSQEALAMCYMMYKHSDVYYFLILHTRWKSDIRERMVIQHGLEKPLLFRVAGMIASAICKM
jgi:hypothetical protein